MVPLEGMVWLGGWAPALSTVFIVVVSIDLRVVGEEEDGWNKEDEEGVTVGGGPWMVLLAWGPIGGSVVSRDGVL